MSGERSTSDAESLLMSSATAHGESAYLRLHDVNVSYAGKWHAGVAKLQPALVDSGFRGRSEERLLPRELRVGQSHAGPRGHKQVTRQSLAASDGQVRVWFNGIESQRTDQRDAAALVADAYSLFLFGPMLLAQLLRAGRGLVLQLSGTQRQTDGERRYECELLNIKMRPGIGLSDGDQMALYIDRDTHLMRRIRFTLEGLESTRGALVEVDTLDPVRLHDIQWPTRFHERLLRPVPLSVHDWRLTGLDVDRRYDVAAIDGSAFAGTALAPASPLPG